MENSSDGDSGICAGDYNSSYPVFKTVELSDCDHPVFGKRNVYMEPYESRKETGKDRAGDHTGRDYTGRREDTA